jgi:hypothetical protein
MITATATPLATPKPLTAAPPKTRISSIDVLRGLVMLITPIDHLREMLHLGHPNPTDLQTTTAVLFFTRWIHQGCRETQTNTDNHRACDAGFFCCFPRFQPLWRPDSLVCPKKHAIQRHVLFECHQISMFLIGGVCCLAATRCGDVFSVPVVFQL